MKNIFPIYAFLILFTSLILVGCGARGPLYPAQKTNSRQFNDRRSELTLGFMNFSVVPVIRFVSVTCLSLTLDTLKSTKLCL